MGFSYNLNFYSKGFPFIYYTALSKNTNVSQIEEIFIPSSFYQSKSYRCLHFIPQNKSLPSIIILTHGMSILGIDDPRVLEVANNLCRAGYEIYLPEFEEVKALKVISQTSENMLDVFLIISKFAQKEGKKLGIFSISFTGGMGLIALSRKEMQGKVNSILALGGFSHFGRLIESVFKNFEYDNYPSLLFLFNFVDFVFEKSEKLKNIFLETALDNALYRTGSNCMASKVFVELNEKEKEFYLNFMNKPNFRDEIKLVITQKLENLIEINSPINYVENLVAPVSLIHGRNDKVIPESESINIANILKRKKMHYNLEITGLLSHGDKVSIWKKLKDVPGLVRAFGYFFNYL